MRASTRASGIQMRSSSIQSALSTSFPVAVEHDDDVFGPVLEVTSRTPSPQREVSEPPESEPFFDALEAQANPPVPAPVIPWKYTNWYRYQPYGWMVPPDGWTGEYMWEDGSIHNEPHRKGVELFKLQAAATRYHKHISTTNPRNISGLHGEFVKITKSLPMFIAFVCVREMCLPPREGQTWAVRRVIHEWNFHY